MTGAGQDHAGGFKDHFSGHADHYARYRPRYPGALLDYLSGLAAARRRAWDCGTGSGQVALDLAERFEQVIASDPSRAQLANARTRAGVSYVAATAECSPIGARSIDLVTVAQALHWFDAPRFYAEVRRVLTPDGVIAVWCYNLVEVCPAVDVRIAEFNRSVVGPFWPPERPLVEAGYATLPFPFRERATPSFAMEASLGLEELLGYLGTWSSTRRYMSARGDDPLPALASRLRPVWPRPDGSPVTVRWPLHLRVGRLP